MPGIQRVRHSVRENRLTWRMIGDGEVVEYLEQRARGWVVEVDGEVVAIGDSETGNIWALFVDPGHERHGHRRRLHDEMVSWLPRSARGSRCWRPSCGTAARRARRRS